uniref:DNA primase/polymerase bifunctional N-terminal domain-containing protein n=1 Tax=Percolomonas cosmopolitus TaxID=63605 RepID=A0A7S1PH23_9EUKA|mmetsp:Transcript_3520/g.13463  ORF Transcript_3520/g.13463 Transcript_3520/m.13463 type:complete len:342 (+) Transcript_3520:122-1147(+)
MYFKKQFNITQHRAIKMYLENNLLPMSLTIEMNSETRDKTLIELPKKFKYYTLRSDVQKFLNPARKHLALKTGYEIQEGYFLVVVDVDSKKHENECCGLKFIDDLFKEHGYTPNTWCQESVSGGYHLFYKVKEADFGNLRSAAKLEKGNMKHAVDLKAKNLLIFCYPTSLNCKQYKWKIAPGVIELEEMPKFLRDLWIKKPSIGRSQENRVTPIDVLHSLCSKIPQDYWDDLTKWNNIGMSMKTANPSNECKQLYEYFSSRSTKYKRGEPSKNWDRYSSVGKYSEGTLRHYAKGSETPRYAVSRKRKPLEEIPVSRKRQRTHQSEDSTDRNHAADKPEGKC